MSNIVFDLDGTLIDIKQRDYQIYSDILIKHLYSPLDIDRYWRLRQMRYNIFELLRLSGINDQLFFSIFLAQRNILMESSKYLSYDTILPNVYTTLDILTQKYHCYLVTVRHHIRNTIVQIDSLKLNNYFTDVIIVNDSKMPSFKKIDDLQAVIGDTENDIEPAKCLNIKSIAVSTGIRSEIFLKKLNPTAVINNISELIKVL